MPRPRYQPAARDIQYVELAAGAGIGSRTIARELGISRGTLLTHLSEPLTRGAARRRLEVVQAVHAAAIRGKVSAMRAYLRRPPQSVED